MQRYIVHRGQGIAGLVRDTAIDGTLQPREVRIRVEAVSLNYRDLLVARGHMGTGDARVPVSDAVGEVIEVGEAVTRVRPGDRVIPLFFPNWIAGDPIPDAIAVSLGGNIDGVLAERIIADEDAVVLAPKTLSWEQAATLACAGLTAWHALFELTTLRPGQQVLIQGTGGVSTWALQLAKTAGFHATVLSSRDDKLEQARAAGADEIINYTTTADWDALVRERIGGVDLALDIGGSDTIGRSIASTRAGGTIATIGGVSGGFGLTIAPFALIGGRKLTGVMVGNRDMAEAFSQYIDAHSIAPAVDSVWAFEQAARAYERLEQERPFGKVVIRVGLSG